MSKKDCEIYELCNHSDHRGELFEVLRFKDQEVPGPGYLYCFTINPGERRGDHYHEKKHEYFACVSGVAIALVEEKSGKRHRIILDSKNPVAVYNAPLTAHAFLNESNNTAVLIAYGSRQHDPENPDTFPKVISNESVF